MMMPNYLKKDKLLKQIDDTWRELNELIICYQEDIDTLEEAKKTLSNIGNAVIKRDWSCDDCLHRDDRLCCDVCSRHYEDLMERTKNND
jgi:hypothetical protein